MQISSVRAGVSVPKRTLPQPSVRMAGYYGSYGRGGYGGSSGGIKGAGVINVLIGLVTLVIGLPMIASGMNQPLREPYSICRTITGEMSDSLVKEMAKLSDEEKDAVLQDKLDKFLKECGIPLSAFADESGYQAMIEQSSLLSKEDKTLASEIIRDAYDSGYRVQVRRGEDRIYPSIEPVEIFDRLADKVLVNYYSPEELQSFKEAFTDMSRYASEAESKVGNGTGIIILGSILGLLMLTMKD